MIGYAGMSVDVSPYITLWHGGACENRSRRDGQKQRRALRQPRFAGGGGSIEFAFNAAEERSCGGIYYRCRIAGEPVLLPERRCARSSRVQVIRAEEAGQKRDRIIHTTFVKSGGRRSPIPGASGKRYLWGGKPQCMYMTIM
jgi:hypothetical protein